MDYIRNVKKSVIATKIKIADLEHNADITRLDNITLDDIKRTEKYKKALEILRR